MHSGWSVSGNLLLVVFAKWKSWFVTRVEYDEGAGGAEETRPPPDPGGGVYMRAAVCMSQSHFESCSMELRGRHHVAFALCAA